MAQDKNKGIIDNENSNLDNGNSATQNIENQQNYLAENSDLTEYSESDFSDEFGKEDYDPDLAPDRTDVATNKTSKALALVVLLIVIIIMLYLLFAPDEEAKIEEEAKEVKVYNQQRNEPDAPEYNVAQEPEGELVTVIEDIMPNDQVVSQIIELEVPELPELKESAISDSNNFSIEPNFAEEDLFSLDKEESNEALVQQEGSDLFLDNDNNILDEAIGNVDNDLQLNKGEERTPILLMSGAGITESADNSIQPSASESVEATKILYPERTIIQGKLIDSVLETAINTDFEGKVRAIVSRDIYADFSNNILIPKGSRVIGSYTGSVATGQTRVLIQWQRLIRPDAIDILIDSPTTDQFGRSGVGGSVDNKYLELFNNSLLLSLITVGSAIAIEESTNSDGVTREEDSDGNTVTSATPSALAAQETIDTISSTAETILSDVLDTSPTITVPHGTRIKIFVNQDLIFPASTISSSSNSGVVFVE